MVSKFPSFRMISIIISQNRRKFFPDCVDSSFYSFHQIEYKVSILDGSHGTFIEFNKHKALESLLFLQTN